MRGAVVDCLWAHYKFVVLSGHYAFLLYAALVGRFLKILASLCGAVIVTPLYRLLVDRAYSRTNVLYDMLTPFLRRSFLRLKGSYNIHTVTSTIARERRGAVISEFLFVLLQVALYNVPSVLLVVTVLGVFINAVPRQFYAQLKMMVRGLHISYLDTPMEVMINQLPEDGRKELRYAGRPVFDDDGRHEAPVRYLAFRGNHHSGTMRVLVTELIDFAFSAVGGFIMLYLLTFSIVIFLDIVGVVDRDEVEQMFPFLLVTIARFAKSLCNLITTENLVNNAAARQGQHELYFLQRLHVVSQRFPNPADYERHVFDQTRRCVRDALEFVGTPDLSGLKAPADGGALDEKTGTLFMYSFLTDAHRHQLERYRGVLDDGAMCLSRSDPQVRDVDEPAAYPPPFANDDSLRRARQYGSALLWHIFDRSRHECCQHEADDNNSNGKVDVDKDIELNVV